MKREFNGISIELAEGDIASQEDIDVVVNAANAQLRTGGGVAGALHRAAGPGLEEECRPLAPMSPGKAVITGGHQLPNSHVIHCLGPVYGQDEPSDKLLADCYRNAVRLAEQEDLKSIAFPSISTGAFGYPVKEAAEIALRTVVDETASLQNIQVIRFVLYGTSARKVHEEVLETLKNG